MIEKIKTDSGIEVIFDRLESISTCSVGVFVKTGSRDESDTEEGISHVLEHMIFKGTPNRNYFEISDEIDYLGANVNAHTTKEETVFYINALTQFLGKSVDILFDIVTNSMIDERELEKEKDVIVEEIKMYKDSPDDLVFEMNYADSINGQYGKPIIGTEASVKGFTADKIRKYYKERYTKDNILIVVSGNFDKEEILQKIDEYFGKLADTKVNRHEKIDFLFNSGKKTVSKDINQVNICISHQSEDYNSKNKIYTDILANVIGGSMSSRLFQEIREKNGLAYSVYTYNQYYLSGGLTSTYIGTNLENYEKAIEITLSEFKKLRENGVTEVELQKAKNKYMSRIAFAMENPRSRMGSEKVKNQVNAVKLEDVNKFAKTRYLTENITILGNIDL